MMEGSFAALSVAERQRIVERADRIRQHVNPLSVGYQAPIQPPDWATVFPQPQHPLHVDMGCGAGRFVLQLAQQQPEWNVVGLEIRKPLVDRANLWRLDAGIRNAYFLFTNATIHQETLFPPTSLSRLTIQFPDPWFKKRHHKRRLVQPGLVAALAEQLRPDSLVFVQSDVAEVASEIVTHFAQHPAFSSPEPVAVNPFGLPTEREQSCLAQGLAIVRYQLWRR
ncbi:MAG: tRNA (guanosine(46)-N7)-methyltransferase TrmB [Synechococcales cyanobacterium]